MAHSGELYNYVYNLDVPIDSILACSKGIVVASNNNGSNYWFWTFKNEI
jgi:hypothetical protein